MLTTGFKLYFGMALGALVAAITFGYTTGGNHTGPLSLDAANRWEASTAIIRPPPGSRSRCPRARCRR